MERPEADEILDGPEVGQDRKLDHDHPVGAHQELDQPFFEVGDVAHRVLELLPGDVKGIEVLLGCSGFHSLLRSRLCHHRTRTRDCHRT